MQLSLRSIIKNATLAVALAAGFGVLDTSAEGQTTKSKTAKKQSPAAENVDDPERFRREYVKAAEEYKSSLQALATSYEGSLSKLTDQHAKLKGLYVDGLISRVEFETSEASLLEARTKIEGVRTEIATTEKTIEAAKKPVPVAGPDTIYSSNSNVAWTTGSAKIDGLIRLYGGRYSVDPYLIYCVMHQESRFGAGAVSSAGAQGLMQLMPGTAARYGVANPFDPAQSIMGGTRYLKDLLRLFSGRVDLALAGYNAGEGAVMKYGNRIPPYRETQNYVKIIGSRYSKGATAIPTAKATERKPTPSGR
jgi:hypothetical protein